MNGSGTPKRGNRFVIKTFKAHDESSPRTRWRFAPLFYFNLPKLIYDVEVDIIYSPFIATITFISLFAAYKLTE